MKGGKVAIIDGGGNHRFHLMVAGNDDRIAFFHALDRSLPGNPFSGVLLRILGNVLFFLFCGVGTFLNAFLLLDALLPAQVPVMQFAARCKWVCT